MSVSDEEDFESDVFIFLKKLPPLIYIVLLFFCLSLIIVSLGEIHGQHDVQMDSVDEVSMGDEDDQSNYHGRSDGDAIRRAVEEARLAEKKRTEEAIARTKARAHVPKNRGYFLLRNSV